MNKNLAFSLLVFFSIPLLQDAFAQDTTRIDSLNKVIGKTPEASLNNIFDMLAKSLEKLDRNQAIRLSKQSLTIAQASQNNLAQILAHRNLGNIYNTFGVKDEALRNFQAAVT